jgi:hypothetical protein
MSERRDKTRKCTSDYFLVFDRETEALIGRVLNLTPGGVMMISESEVPTSKSFQCKMVMPGVVGRHKFITFDAESRWSKKNTRLGWYETGYQIISLSKADQQAIDMLLGDWVIKDQTHPYTVTVGND